MVNLTENKMVDNVARSREMSANYLPFHQQFVHSILAAVALFLRVNSNPKRSSLLSILFLLSLAI